MVLDQGPKLLVTNVLNGTSDRKSGIVYDHGRPKPLDYSLA